MLRQHLRLPFAVRLRQPGGIVLPALTGIAPSLTPIAAAGIVMIMVGAAVTHFVRKEPALVVPNIILGAAAAFVAWGRFGEYAIA